MMVLQAETFSKIEQISMTLLDQGTHLGLTLLKALIIFILGKLAINLINKLVRRFLDRKDIDPSVRTFVGSLVNISLIILLIISVISALGVQTTSFAALLASVGVAVGMALSGNLSNFAGGLIILLFKPFKVGDFISSNGVSGTVQEIQIFHTILKTPENITVYLPNGGLSSGIINNFNVDKRRVEWVFSVDYGVDYEKVKRVVLDILAQESRILAKEYAPFVELNQLADSSVNIVVRVWTKASDYWDVYFKINKEVYETFNAQGINFPFTQITVHQV